MKTLESIQKHMRNFQMFVRIWQKVMKYLQKQRASYDDLVTIITETDREHQQITERILNVLDRY